MSTWRPTTLPDRVGGSIRVQHCSDSKSCKLTRRAAGVAWYCFRCPPGENRGWIPDVLPIAQRTLDPVEAGDWRLYPEDDHPIPEQYRLWLAGYGLGAREIHAVGVRYSQRSQRLLWPVNGLTGPGLLWMGRSNCVTPKWLTDWSLCPEGFVPGVATLGNLALSEGTLTVVTEDPISAWKAAQAGFDGVPLVGTRVTDTTLRYLLGLRSVVLALDPDYYGQLYEDQLETRLKRLGVNVIRPRMPLDPKDIPAPKIAQTILEAL